MGATLGVIAVLNLLLTCSKTFLKHHLSMVIADAISLRVYSACGEWMI